MKNSPVISQAKGKYNNARSSLLVIMVCSVLNILLIMLAGRYFLFSAYLPKLLSVIGYQFYLETEMILFPVMMGAFALATIVPYLLCWIFSKKHVGWMIGALAFFSVDSLLFLIDFSPIYPSVIIP